MTIQLPVLLWTVICFVMLMLILSRLLFRPLLAFMDRREERIRSAARTLEEHEKARRDAEEALARFREEEAERADRLAKEAAARAGKEAAAVLASAAAEQERAVEACRLSLAEEKKTLEKAADDKADELARAFLAALMKS